MILVRNIRFARPPDNRGDPGKRGENHVNHGAEHEDQRGAVPPDTIVQLAEEQTEHAVYDTKNDPADHACGQEISGHAKKTQNRHCSQKAQNSRSSDVALHGEPLQERNMIRNDQPSSEDQTEAHTRVNASADGRVAKEMQPAVAGQMHMYGHPKLGPLMPYS